MNSLAILAMSIMVLPDVECLKQRKWVGPWQFFEGSAPRERLSFGFTAWNDTHLFVHGGQDLYGTWLNDLHQFKISERSWTDLSDATFGTAPSPRSGHALVTINDKLVVFGGAMDGKLDPSWANIITSSSDEFEMTAQWFNDVFIFEPSMLLWTNISDRFPELPDVRTLFAYAVIDTRLYIFGGFNTYGCLNDLSYLDLKQYIWEAIEMTTPPEARWASAMASVGSVLYLYGGANCSQLFGERSYYYEELFSFNTSAPVLGEGYKWAAIDNATRGRPGVRAMHVLVSMGDKIYLHSGETLIEGPDNEPQIFASDSDVFLFDPTMGVWTNLTSQVSGMISPPRMFHSAATVDDSVYIFGGIDIVNLVAGRRRTLNDLYQLNLSNHTWHDFTGDVRGKLPSPRRGSYMAICGKDVMILGGSDAGGPLYDLMQFNLETLLWSSSGIRIDDQDVKITGNYMLFSLRQRFYVLFSKSSNENVSNMYEYDPSSDVWTNLSLGLKGDPFPPRSSYNSAIVGDSVVYFFGGVFAGAYYNDLHALEVSSSTSWVVSAKGTPPSPRCCCGVATAGKQLFVFGGFNAQPYEYMNDLHSFDTFTNTWTKHEQHGDIPSIRRNLGLVSFGPSLYLFGGQYSGIFNDLYQLDPVSLEWTSLSASNLPFARTSHAVGVNSGKLFVFGGTNSTGFLNDLHSITLPKHIQWPSHTEIFGALVDVFDWDTLVPSLDGSILASSLSLGTGLIPSKMTIQGPGLLTRQGNGTIVCLVANGCSNVDMSTVTMRCDSEVSLNALFKMEKTALNLRSSSFSNCRSMADGGTIQAYDGATITVDSCKFEHVHSSGRGGAVSALGSELTVYDTIFRGAMSDLDGGAVWASSFDCFGSDQGLPDSTLIHMRNVRFENCSSKERGGGISASSRTVKILIADSVFSDCSAGNYGGALSLDSAANAGLVNVSLVDNIAFGLGGGAFRVDSAQLNLEHVFCEGNSAPAGGGGVVFWDGRASILVKPPGGAADNRTRDVTDVKVDEMRSIHICGDTNRAVYGPCFATPFRSLQLQGLPSPAQPSYPGIPFTVQATKHDAYGQTVASDSKSVLEGDSELLNPATPAEGTAAFSGSEASANPDVLVAGQNIVRLRGGQGQLTLSIQPTFTNLSLSDGRVYLKSTPYVRIHGTDLQTFGSMAAPAFDPFVPTGRRVCPPGYVLSLSAASAGQSQQASFRRGQCHWCQEGTYSVDPLAGPMINEPSCYTCPLGGYCAGGPNVTFALGDWRVVEGAYRLTACPSGHALLNTVGKIFQHDIQRCVPCEPTQYVVNSSNPLYSCQDCPAGALCDGDALSPRVAGAVFVVDTAKGKYILTSCPPGYYLDAPVQACQLCPAGYYCVGGALNKDSCRPGTFAGAGANASQACKESVFVLATVVLPLSRAQFEALREKYLDAVMATVGVDQDHVIIESINRRQQVHTPFLGAMGNDGLGAFKREGTAIGAAESRTSEMNDWKATEKPAAHAVGSNSAAMTGGVSEEGKSFVGTRRAGETVQVVTKLVTAEAGAATRMSARIAGAGQQLNTELLARGLPAGTITAVEVAGTPAGDNRAEAVVIGSTIAGFLAFLLLGAITVKALYSVHRVAAHRQFVSAFEQAKPGAEAQAHHLPLELQAMYIPEQILGNGAFACVVKVMPRTSPSNPSPSENLLKPSAQAASKTVHQRVKATAAIKLVLPAKGRELTGKGRATFDPAEKQQLHREARALQLMTAQRCSHAVHELGLEGIKVTDSVAWFTMELLDGKNLADLLRPGDQVELFADLECIKRHSTSEERCEQVARNVLPALKVLHDNGLVHRDVKPANIMRVAAASGTSGSSSRKEHTYKLIDFGCCMEFAADDKVQNTDSTGTGKIRESSLLKEKGQPRRAWEGTPAYMSPETARDPWAAGSPKADVWSLGVTLFELATGELPFLTESSGSGWDLEVYVANLLDDGCSVPNLLDRIPVARRAAFDHNLAQVVERALKRRPEDRYNTVDDMHDAVYQCLINKGEATYSVFISYRVASEAYLARLLYDELNHTVTPGGHRVTVFWDAVRLVKGDDWEDGFSTGLLNSLCFFPILSYGSTAPLASLPERDTALLLGQGWDARPVGRTRLAGTASDGEDNVLKEFLIAETLAKRRKVENRPAEELGKIQIIYPILVGRLHPPQHPGYPGMGDYFQVQGGGGQFEKTPSLRTNQAVANFLEEKARLPEDVIENVLKRSVNAAVSGLTKLQGCQLWKQASGAAGTEEANSKTSALDKVELTKEQSKLVGTGCAGPPVDLPYNGTIVPLTQDQQFAISQGVNEEQLRFAKAAVRASVRDFHEVIDRAVASAKRIAVKGVQAAGGAPVPAAGQEKVTSAAARSSAALVFQVPS